ncbi:MAG: VCBS repeat-containing protein, partial [Candidatus Marinimicrobia bacterium]|nr:VCBS repeat-containing protein [Candidatus Neomarinimicrobiota bacterium]
TNVVLDNELDNDGILNPSEGFSVSYSISNNSFEADAFNTIATLTVSDGGIITSSDFVAIDDILLGETETFEFSIQLNDEIAFGDFDMNLLITAEYINNYGEVAVYEKNVEYSVDVSLNQFGFPFSTAEIKASPLVIDLDDDGDKEIIFGDNNGFVHVYNADGSEVDDDTFPFDTGNQIWGSAAAADMDNDGKMDFVITSKSKHLYIFDKDGLKTDYNANKYLMGTPAIGNVDDDADLEVIIGGYSSPASSNQIFAVNADGTDVDGFPLTLGEKVKAGLALADFNGNGKDDIIVGTDDDNLHLIYDDGTTADGFPYTTGDKIQAAPSVHDIDGE